MTEYEPYGPFLVRKTMNTRWERERAEADEIRATFKPLFIKKERARRRRLNKAKRKLEKKILYFASQGEELDIQQN